jgi:hypothetical protein
VAAREGQGRQVWGLGWGVQALPKAGDDSSRLRASAPASHTPTQEHHTHLDGAAAGARGLLAEVVGEVHIIAAGRRQVQEVAIPASRKTRLVLSVKQQQIQHGAGSLQGRTCSTFLQRGRAAGGCCSKLFTGLGPGAAQAGLGQGLTRERAPTGMGGWGFRP